MQDRTGPPLRNQDWARRPPTNHVGLTITVDPRPTQRRSARRERYPAVSWGAGGRDSQSEVALRRGTIEEQGDDAA